MKILHIINDLSNNGGAQKFLVDLVSEHPKGVTIKILSLSEENAYVAQLQQQNVECLYWQRLSWQQRWQWLRWADVIHSHLFPSIYYALLAVGKAKIQTEHNSHNRRRDYPYLKFMEHLVYRQHDLTVNISERVKEELIKFMPHYESKYTVVYNGVDLSRFPLQTKRAPCEDEIVKIGMVGRLHDYKDQSTLIHALTLLPERFQLHLAGDGDNKATLSALAAKLSVQDRVHFHGITNDVPQFLAELNVYVQSSKVEGFGLAAVEAMAAGLPVLGSDIPGLDEVIGKPEYLFPLSDAQYLAEQIRHLTEDPDHYAAASAYAIKRCQDFTIETFRERYYGLYQAVYSA